VRMKIGMAVLWVWIGLALIGEFPTVRWLLALCCLGAALCGDRYIAIGIAILFFAALIAKFNPPRFG
jgi:hypothetical protein